ncbi:MAG: transcriptional regulator [Pseudomonadota bacterium]
MNTKLQQVLGELERLPLDRQEELAEALSALAAAPSSYTAEQLAAVDEGIADADAGRFAADEEIASVFARYRAV